MTENKNCSRSIATLGMETKIWFKIPHKSIQSMLVNMKIQFNIPDLSIQSMLVNIKIWFKIPHMSIQSMLVNKDQFNIPDMSIQSILYSKTLLPFRSQGSRPVNSRTTTPHQVLYPFRAKLWSRLVHYLVLENIIQF